MTLRTNRPANADFSTLRVERLFPNISKYCAVTASASLADLLSVAIPANAGKVRICPHGDINIDFGVDASATSSLLKSNVVYEIEGYKAVLDNIMLYGAGGTVNVSVIVYVDDTVVEQFESSSSSSSEILSRSSASSISSASTSSESSSSESSASTMSGSSGSSSSNSSNSSSSKSSMSLSSNSSSSSSSKSVSSNSSSSTSSEVLSRSSASSASSESSSSEILSRSSASSASSDSTGSSSSDSSLINP